MTFTDNVPENDFGTRHLLDTAGVPLCGCSYGFLTGDVSRCNCPACFDSLVRDGSILHPVLLVEVGH